MRIRTLVHLLPWLLILGLGSCYEKRVALQAGPEEEPAAGRPGVEAERGGPGFLGAAA